MPVWLQKTWNWLKVAGTWIKGHAILLVLGVLLVYALVASKNKKDLYEQLLSEFQGQQAKNAKDIQDLRNIQQENLRKQEEINRKYNEVLDRIQKNYHDQLQNLDAQKEQDLRRIIAANHDDPNAMANDINALFEIRFSPFQPLKFRDILAQEELHANSF